MHQLVILRYHQCIPSGLSPFALILPYIFLQNSRDKSVKVYHNSAVSQISDICEPDKECNVEMLPHLNILKDKGNKMYKNSDFHSAIMYYNTAMQQGGHIYARFYANRAAAYISRNW